MKSIPIFLVVSALAGCASSFSPSPARMDVSPAPFPFPGVYNGATVGGQLTYQIRADGRGRSCTRAINGRMAFGDAIYTGARLHTEDGTLDIVRLTESELVLTWAKTSATLRRMSEPPATCREFFGKG